jgi:integrase
MQLTELEQRWPDSPWLFHRNGRRLDPHLNGWKGACKRAGVPNLLFHDLRRTAIRNMERAGVPRRVAMEISGHRTEEVYRRYDIVSPKDLRLAATKMEAYLAESKTLKGQKMGHKLATPEHRA